jgi:hypothetical protein
MASTVRTGCVNLTMAIKYQIETDYFKARWIAFGGSICYYSGALKKPF